MVFIMALLLVIIVAISISSVKSCDFNSANDGDKD